MRWPFSRSTESDPDTSGEEIAGDESSELARVQTDIATTEPVAPGTRSLSQGWARLLRSNRIIWVIAGVAIVSLVGGLLLGGLVISPSQAALNAEAPDAGLISVPVELRELSNNVTIRADVGYADAVDVQIETSDLGGPAVVTGQVPVVGANLNPLSVALEVAGRPVIVLPGSLPAYRTLRIGVSGPDVLQLKQALSAVGINPGDVTSNVFDQATSTALTQLYASVGYPVPSSPEGTAESVRAAQDGVRAAEDNVAAAQRELNAAGAGPSAATKREQDNLVNAAQRSLDAATVALSVAEAQVPQDPIVVAQAQEAVANAADSLALAELRRTEALAPRDTSAQQAMLNAAYAQLDAAHAQLGEAQKGALTYLPAGEVMYLEGMPRRVDEVFAKRGAILQGVAMKVSGADLLLTGSAAAADAALLTVGDEAIFALPDGTDHGATITQINAPTGSGDTARWDIVLTPDPLTAAQVEQLRGQNVRVGIPVGATDGAVLAVPLAALTAGPGGESRVEVVVGDPTTAEATTRLVVVETGLAAEGYVEVAPLEGELDEGDLVVVGR